MIGLLPLIMIGGFFVVAVLTRKLPPRVDATIALVLAVGFLVFAITDPSHRFSHLSFFVLGIGIGLYKLGVFRRTS
jgi:NhaP-type Na+/H+ or K+/H+ antiporter